MAKPARVLWDSSHTFGTTFTIILIISEVSLPKQIKRRDSSSSSRPLARNDSISFWQPQRGRIPGKAHCHFECSESGMKSLKQMVRIPRRPTDLTWNDNHDVILRCRAPKNLLQSERMAWDLSHRLWRVREDIEDSSHTFGMTLPSDAILTVRCHSERSISEVKNLILNM